MEPGPVYTEIGDLYRYSGAFSFLTYICFGSISLFKGWWAGERKDMKFPCLYSEMSLLHSTPDTKPRNGLVRPSANWQGPKAYWAS